MCTYKPQEIWDCLIVGSGAAGLSAAINGASEGLKILVVDRNSLTGGLIGTTSLIENYPGFPDGIEGRVLTGRMTEQAMKFGAEFMLSTIVHAISQHEEKNLFEIRVETLYDIAADRSIIPIYAKSVILASGRNHKKLGLGNESELVETGKLLYGHPQTHIPHKGHICVIGAGNSAGQAATWLTTQACAVTIITPHDLSKTMSDYLVQRINSPKSYVNVVKGRVNAVNQMSNDLLVYAQRENGDNHTISVDRIYCLVGLEVDDTFRDMKDDKGFLYTDTPGIYVAGDCRQQSEKRCTAAVGEGVKAISQVHQWLATLENQ